MPARTTSAATDTASGAGTQETEHAFDPTVGNPSAEPPADSRPAETGPAAGGEPEDETASGDPEAGEPSGSEADADPAEEALSYYETLSGGKEPETQEQSDDTLAPDKLKAEIESSTQDPQERFERLLSHVGKQANELGALRKEIAAHKALVTELEKLTTRAPDGRPTFHAGAVLRRLIEDLGIETVRDQLAAANLSALLPAPSDADPADERLVAEVAKACGLNTEGLSPDEQLALVHSDPRASLLLQRRLRELDLQRHEERLARQQQAQQAREREAAEVRAAVAALEKNVPHFEELAPAMEKLHAAIPSDRPLRGAQRVEVLRALAEVQRFPSVLKSVAENVRAAERTRLTKALLALGWKESDAQAVFADGAAGKGKTAGKGKAAGNAAGGSEAGRPGAGLREDGSYDTWTS